MTDERSCTQPFLVKGGRTCRPDAFPSPALLGESIAPHHAQYVRTGAPMVYGGFAWTDHTVDADCSTPQGRLWVEKNPASQTSGRRAGTKINLCFCTDTRRAKTLLTPGVPASLARFGVHPQFWEPSAAGPKIPASQPAQPVGAGRYRRRYRAAGQAKGAPRRVPQPEKVGPGRKNLFLPGVLLAFFQSRAPPAGPGNRGRCAPRSHQEPRPPAGYAVPPSKKNQLTKPLYSIV